ncbi:hypothetical protein FRZ61_45340 [Hypericibacter adhaerens]|uniref:histidine kinase n=1 Tax=Hypericibacter adhaerens TaxID=2602016 RepID=A0A5J6N734_9PROT|nr:CHASE3 domain-containing protein [Hypericibacter adhaerens]QEX24593.1 hypothetical protein FRZ61_45340 [Hypericibacter adhaerens]
MSVADASRSRHEPPFGGLRHRWGRRIALWLAILLVGGLFGATYYQIHGLAAADGIVQHVRDVRGEAEHLLSLLGRAEDNQEGYLITGDPTYLDAYRAAATEAPQSLQQLSQLFGDNPSQWRRVDQLRPMLSDRIDRLEALIVARQGRGLSAIVRPGIDEGRALTDKMRETIVGVVATESDSARSRLSNARAYVQNSALILFAGILASAMVILWAFHLTQKEVDRRQRSEAMLLQDLAASRVAESQLARAQRMETVAQLTSGMAHDVNNLLAIVVSGLSQLEKRMGADGKAEELMSVCMRASLQGSALIDRLLAFSRRRSLEPERINVNELVSSTLGLLQPIFGVGIEIQLRLAEDPWPVLVDPVQAESALVNLAINARDAMTDGGQLTIETANMSLSAGEAAGKPSLAPGDYVTLSMSDTGTGMTPEVLGRAFEPFFTTKVGGRSSGLGLSMVLGFARQSRGHVEIRSEPKRGTVVDIYLPRADSASPRAALPSDQ